MIFETPPANFSPICEVVACFCEYEGNIVLLKRHAEKDHPHTWCIPGGKVDAGETPLQSIVREISEETGISILEEDVEHRKTVYTRFPECDFVFHMFGASFEEKPKIQLSTTEHVDFCWVTPEESIRMDLLPGNDRCISLVYHLHG